MAAPVSPAHRCVLTFPANHERHHMTDTTHMTPEQIKQYMVGKNLPEVLAAVTPMFIETVRQELERQVSDEIDAIERKDSADTAMLEHLQTGKAAAHDLIEEESNKAAQAISRVLEDFARITGLQAQVHTAWRNPGADVFALPVLKAVRLDVVTPTYHHPSAKG